MFKNWFKSDKDHPAFSVLVVSDDGNTLASIRSSLTEEGCEVHSAVSAEAGVKLLDEIELPDVIIGDFYYPERDGKHFLNKARIRFGKSAQREWRTLGTRLGGGPKKPPLVAHSRRVRQTYR